MSANFQKIIDKISEAFSFFNFSGSDFRFGNVCHLLLYIEPIGNKHFF